jgi:hypothetical protein
MRRSIIPSILLTGLAISAASILFAQQPATKPAAKPRPSTARTFATPEAARDGLIQALETQSGALVTLLGTGTEGILSTGDQQVDEKYRQSFLEAIKTKNNLMPDAINPNKVYLDVGEEEWPFPFPIVKGPGGWSFDSTQGKEEYRYRIIGGNELDVIELCQGYVEAQLEYAEADRDGDGINEYAQQFLSSEGKKDGLYWKGEDSPVSQSFADSVLAQGYRPERDKPILYHGYYFKILKAQGAAADGGEHEYVIQGHMIGGFAMVAWPANYGMSGIKTFIVNQDGIVFDNDLGPNTDAIARAMTKYNPDESWRELP